MFKYDAINFIGLLIGSYDKINFIDPVLGKFTRDSSKS